MTDKTPKIPHYVERIPKHPTKKAGEEEAAMNRGEPLNLLDADGKENDHRRRQWVLNSLNIGLIFIITFGIITIIGFLGTWALHLTRPFGMKPWLEENEVQNIQFLLLSGAVSSLMTIAINNFKR